VAKPEVLTVGLFHPLLQRRYLNCFVTNSENISLKITEIFFEIIGDLSRANSIKWLYNAVFGNIKQLKNKITKM